MKMFYLFILLSFSSFADELCETSGSPFVMPQAIVEVMDAVALTQKAVSPSQFEQAPCKTFEVPEYDWWLENHVTDNRRNGHVKGFNFQNQPQELMDAFRDIVKNLPARNSSCTTVLCAVDEIWGPQIGRRILYIRARHGYNTSEYVYEKTIRFESSQLDDIIITLADLPPEMERIGHNGNQRMSLQEAGDRSTIDPYATADSSIKFFDPWKSANKYRRRYGLFHEFGHNIAFINRKDKRDRKSLDSSEEWLSLPSCPVSTYGNKDKGEDFAESFLMYRFNGPGLKQKCPEKYNFLRDNVFKPKGNGIRAREYLDDSQCN